MRLTNAVIDFYNNSEILSVAGFNIGLTTATPKSIEIDYKRGEFLENATFWYDTRINMIYLSTNR